LEHPVIEGAQRADRRIALTPKPVIAPERLHRAQRAVTEEASRRPRAANRRPRPAQNALSRPTKRLAAGILRQLDKVTLEDILLLRRQTPGVFINPAHHGSPLKSL